MSARHGIALISACLCGALLCMPPELVWAAAKHASTAPTVTAAQIKAGDLDIVRVRKNFYVLVGPHANSAVFFGADGAMLVNTQTPAMAPAIIGALKKLTEVPLRYIVNTNMLAENTGGNLLVTKVGRFIGFRGEVPYADILAHENVLQRMSGALGGAKPAESASWPIDTYYKSTMDLHFNDEAIQLIYEPHAQTDGDSIVFFRGSDVICTGGLFVPSAYPFFDPDLGGSVQGLIDALNHVIDLAIPDVNEEGGTLIVSGSGRVTDEYDLVTYRDMLTIIRDRVRDLIGRGLSVEQVLAAQPSRDYDGIYGAESGEWTTRRFIQAVYADLKKQPTKGSDSSNTSSTHP
jgi:cyclase